MAFPPITSGQRIRRDASLTLPNLLRSSCPLFPCLQSHFSKTLRNPVGIICVCAFFFVRTTILLHVRLTNVTHSQKKKKQIKPDQCDCLARLQTEPLPALLFMRSSHSENRSNPFSNGGSFRSSCSTKVTQKRTQTRQGYDPHFCLSFSASYQERTYIEPFWIALTLKEKRHYEVCLQRIFTRLAGVGLKRLGEEARHRRLVIMILVHNT